jgi:hypothetical protein
MTRLASLQKSKYHGDGSIGVVSCTRCSIEPDEAEKSGEANMAGPALAYAYHCRHASTLEATPTSASLTLVTWSARGSLHPHFFERRLTQPGRAADLLRGLVEAAVRGADVEHLVRMGTDGDRSTWRWFAKHRNERGPCKHILAVQITLEEEGLP